MWRRAAGRGLAAGIAVLYLVLSLNALTCALRHGLDGPCVHQAAMPHGETSHGDMAGHAMPGHAPDGAPDSVPAPAGDRAHHSLCHCLDNLAAEPAPLLTATAAPLPAPPLAAPPTAPARGPVWGPAAPRGPPAALA